MSRCSSYLVRHIARALFVSIRSLFFVNDRRCASSHSNAHFWCQIRRLASRRDVSVRQLSVDGARESQSRREIGAGDPTRNAVARQKRAAQDDRASAQNQCRLSRLGAGPQSALWFATLLSIFFPSRRCAVGVDCARDACAPFVASVALSGAM